MKNKIPPKNTTSKYGFSSMKAGQKKSFSYDDASKIRLSAHFTGKRYGWKFTTRKSGDKIIVYREE